jgi:hypothetical protein
MPHPFKMKIQNPHLELHFQSRHSSASLYFATIFTHPLKITFCLKTSPIAVTAFECLTNSKSSIQSTHLELCCSKTSPN